MRYLKDLDNLIFIKKWNFDLNENTGAKFVAANDPIIWFFFHLLIAGLPAPRQ